MRQDKTPKLIAIGIREEAFLKIRSLKDTLSTTKQLSYADIITLLISSYEEKTQWKQK
jgi:hypothetical protein